MTEYEPTLRTIVLVITVSTCYLVFLIRRTLQGKIDFYDLLALSTCGVLPAAFVSWPRLAVMLGEMAGVAFPFVVMFGSLILIVFVILHRTTVKLHEIERVNRQLIQEVGLLRALPERKQA